MIEHLNQPVQSTRYRNVMFSKELKLNFKWIGLIICVVAIVGAFTSRIIWTVNLESGVQSYQRLIFGVEIKTISEYEYSECSGKWENPLSELSGIQTISNCNLLSLCEAETIEPSVISSGCRR